MSILFFDTSAVAKRYIREPGTAWIQKTMAFDEGHTIVISALTTVEMASVLARQVQTKKLRETVEERIIEQFRLDVERRYQVIPLTDVILIAAQQMARRHMLRALDSVQLACALQAAKYSDGTITFICGDNKLLAAASAEGFSTDNPYLHL